ncbi:isopentenyl-diphosphate Delta-isomerase [Janibacter cremeus]|uniref:isopentenyl-diphosphate Delta-isomerase n=1 Tax=Janibacter cremeus TaxID=1285192 RepID=UPI0023F98595|nr:isopentenyl-diphosphate Delta-isomerase [Janibacter cremeus]WEV76848.1 isopentenyl-diphosphate Delta-isomerase [Janibacter cremeus]
MSSTTRTSTPGPPRDEVVLLDAEGRPVGTAPREDVHGEDTPLHLAFSCYVHDEAGRVLLTRRALVKRAWPGVWTNSFCGHPRPGEDPEAAVHRYAQKELGLRLTALRPILPDFRYRAVDTSGIVENEVCPVYAARAVDGVRPNSEEVMDHAWLTGAELAAAVDAAPWALSPWLLEQWDQLRARHLDTWGEQVPGSTS